MIASLGSGFGLYGYLPALAGGCGQTVLLPERYRTTFAQRPELAGYSEQICWCADDGEALDRADGVVIAQRPLDQATWIPLCLQRPNIQRLLLEKPLAHTPERAAELLADLNASGRIFRLNYSFAHLSWREVLRTALQGPVQIDWQFCAHHFRTGLDTWKRHHAVGGGVLRFYGIHLIALLAELGYDDVAESYASGANADEPAQWSAVFTGPNVADCAVHIDSHAQGTSFRIDSVQSDGCVKPLVNLTDPFDAEPPSVDGLDRRVPVLTRLCLNLLQPLAQPSDGYDASIRLWQTVEDRTQVREGGHRAEKGH